MTPAVSLSNVSLAYSLTRNRAGTLKEYAIDVMRRRVEKEVLWALDDVTLELHPGEVLGVIGANGAGKSTLMKVVARVLPPTKGRVVVRGVVAPMIELGAGFNMEMTAYENIVLYGTLLGRTPSEMRDQVGKIAEWAELTEFVDVPLRSYSSGMLARLGFAVATDTDPHVLVVDEVLSVGDASFQEKSKKRILDLIESGTAVLFVSHAMGAVLELADRVLWLDHGRSVMMGDSEEVISSYTEGLSTN